MVDNAICRGDMITTTTGELEEIGLRG